MPRHRIGHPERFAAKVVVAASGCWEWQGGIRRDGYGRFYADRFGHLAHRYSYELHVGPIPSHLQIDHLCRNRACCNPEHLEAVTARENVLRGESIQARNATKTHCPHGHEYTPENTYWFRNKRDCRACDRARNRARRAA